MYHYTIDFNQARPTSLRWFKEAVELVGYEFRERGARFDYPVIRIYFVFPPSGQLYVSETRDKPIIRDQLQTAMQTESDIAFRTEEYQGQYGGLRGIVLVARERQTG